MKQERASVARLPELMSIPALAARFSVSRSTAYDWVRTGRIGAYRLGGCLRVELSEAMAFLRAHREGGAR